DQPVRIDKLLYTGVLALTMQPFLSWIVYWNNQIKLPAFLSGVETWMQNMEAQMNDTVQLLLVTNSFGTFLVNVLIIAVLTAIGEEFFFRGTLQRMLTDVTKKPYLAAIVIGILFSIIHFQFYGFFARAFMGIFFGIMVVNSKSLLLPIVAHAVNNAYGVFMYYYCTKNDIPIETFDNPSEPPTLWIVAVSLFVSALIYRTILRIIRDKHAG
ncbi:MAG: lysostaphin resistance A-like protein, partial [Bacteroidales bacterium]